MSDEFIEGLDPDFLKLDQLYLELEANLSFFSPRSHKIFVDVYQCMGGAGGGGLESFWSADIPRRRMMKSFRALGENRISELLEESKWIKKSIHTDVELTEEESSRLEDMNIELFNRFDNLQPKLIQFAESKKLL